MRTCKKCGIAKEHRFLIKDDFDRNVFKDESGGIWHGRVCYNCQRLYVKEKSRPRCTPLTIIFCQACGKECEQKAKKQKTCSLSCYQTLRKR